MLACKWPNKFHCFPPPLTHAAIEEEYQECLKRKQDKEAEFQDTKSEMDGLFIEVERYQARLEQLTQREAEASEDVATLPAKVSELKRKIRSAEELFTPGSNC